MLPAQRIIQVFIDKTGEGVVIKGFHRHFFPGWRWREALTGDLCMDKPGVQGLVCELVFDHR